MSLALKDRLALLRAFLADAEERLARLEAGLGEGERASPADLAREAHTLVGAAGVVGLDSVAGAARALEEALAAMDGEAARERLAALRRQVSAVRGGRRVLAIEDDPTNRLLLDRLAEQDPRVALALAHDGETGLRLARDIRPDLVLLDLRLPDLDGEEVLARLRADVATSTVPVVVLSSDAAPQRAAELLAAGAAAYLTKPVDLERLLALMTEGPGEL